MPVPALKHFLDEHGVKYAVITHSPAFTAQEIAARAHISGKELAKTVILKIDGRLAMAVLPASQKVDLDELGQVIGGRIEIAQEEQFRSRFPECDPGAMPPFGNLYDMDVYVADSLAEDAEIAFNAGSFTELIQMAYEDFERLVHPRVLHFGARV
jgi:Ala-tRNA(Pro) deacylase